MKNNKPRQPDYKDEKFLINICDQEPIHIPGSIQSFGYALVLDLSGKVIFASENIPDLFEVTLEEVIGADLGEIIQEDAIIGAALLESDQIQYFFNRTLGKNSRDFDIAILPPTNLGYRTIEIEPSQDSDIVEDLYADGIDLLESASTQEELLDKAAHWVKRIIGFDRVKIYLFDEFWNGTVNAEAREPHMPSFLGLRFPATDIPKQARALYVLNKVRLIGDVLSKPVPLLPEAPISKSVDLTHSGLRAVSPIHIEYLRNMKVGASFSVSIVQQGKLVGLIACHHAQAKHLSLRVRKKAEVIGRSISLEMKRLQLEKAQSEKIVFEEQVTTVTNALKRSGDLLLGMENMLPDLTDLLNADGVAFVNDQQILTYGLTLDPKEITSVEKVLEPHQRKSCQTWSSISELDLSFKQNDVAGMLRIPLDYKGVRWLLAFRKERIKDVLWGGGDNKNAKEINETEDGKFRVSPRKSFEVYKQSVRGYSEPWGDHTLYELIRTSFLELLLDPRNAPSVSSEVVNLMQSRNDELKKLVAELRLELIERKGVEHKLNLALEVGAIGSWELNRALQNVSLDTRAMDILDTYESVHTVEGFIALFSRSYRDKLRKVIQSDSPDSISEELSFKRAEGDERTLLLRSESVGQSIAGILMDVTDVRLLQGEIQQAQYELTQFFNTDLMGTFVANEDGDILHCNDYFLEVLGYDRSFFESSELNWRVMSPIDQYPRDMDMIRLTMNGERISYEKQFFTSEGKRLDTIFGLSYHTELGRFYGMIRNNALEVVERNRTERIIQDQRKMLLERHQKLQEFNRDLVYKNKELEREIGMRKKFEESSNLLGHAVSNSTEMVIITGAEFIQTGGQPKIIYVNDALLKKTGYTEEEVIGKSPKIFQNNNTDKDIKKVIRKAMRSCESVQVRLINSGKTGTEYVVELSISPVFDSEGVCTHFIGIQRDVTDEVERLTALNKAKNQFQIISENLPEALVAIVDGEGVIEYLGGKGSSNIPKEKTNIFDAFKFSDKTDKIIQNWLDKRSKEVLSIEGSINGREFEIYAKSIDAVTVEPEIVVLAQDITSRKEVFRLKEHALEEASQLAAMKTQFINTASHQLKTPMSSIELNLSMLQVLVKDANDERLQKIVGRLKVESSRLLRLMEDTLQISRINSDAFEMQLVKIDFVNVIQSQIDLFENTIEYKERKINFVHASENCFMETDLRLVEQMVHNLISNALKYSEEEVNIRLNCTDSKTILEVEDFGIGIPELELNKIRTEFYRATNSVGKSGTGLGLFLVQAIVERLGGQLEIISEEQIGSTFKVIL